MNRDRRVQEEIDFHIAQQTAKNIRAGMPPDEAERDARVRFGGRQGTREAAKDAATGRRFGISCGTCASHSARSRARRRSRSQRS
jgi:hypothetical protein